MLGNVMYLHSMRLAELLAIKQEISPDRFVKIVKETPVGGGKEFQYMEYEAVSLNTSKTFIINNYLSPYTLVTLTELKEILETVKSVIDENRYNAMLSIIEEVKE